jgi:hypothetical protein
LPRKKRFSAVQAQDQGERHFLERQTVCDSNIITVNGSGTLEFAKEIMLLLKAKPFRTFLGFFKFFYKSPFPE